MVMYDDSNDLLMILSALSIQATAPLLLRRAGGVSP